MARVWISPEKNLDTNFCRSVLAFCFLMILFDNFRWFCRGNQTTVCSWASGCWEGFAGRCRPARWHFVCGCHLGTCRWWWVILRTTILLWETKSLSLIISSPLVLLLDLLLHLANTQFYSRCIYVFTNLTYHIWTLISHWFDHHKLLHWTHAYQMKGCNFTIFLLYFIVVKA